MSDFPPIHSFADALEMSKSFTDSAGKKRLLLGNGFSMACFGGFGYTALYERVKNLGIPEKVQKIFEKYGETNFEAILKLLDDSSWVAETYGLCSDGSQSEIKKDYEALKLALTNAITEVHPEHRGLITDEKYNACYAFISNFDDIYTVNYDLLLYWTSLHREPFAFTDSFSKDKDTDGNDCEFMPHNHADGSGLYFLHGALHLYSDGKVVRKRVWKETNIPLVTQIRAALEDKKYPLVVAEGDSDSKLEHIQESSYLSNCLRKFRGIQGHLFAFGHSLSDQDRHIVEVISKNVELRHLWIGIRGDFTKPTNQRFLDLAQRMQQERKDQIGDKKFRGKKGDLTVHFYDADSAKVWG
ncbi:hypothetical protein A3D69_01090 [Candidatus Uhrbacteria bacterium RIFCSPHIGHO2_02_FULL_54_11]|nr:MAG: hypothetical protein A3D69_01090 [Candidatus Uhrbacteria bacterium RIFCSPHIGHO2_02_FULL_54_11]